MPTCMKCGKLFEGDHAFCENCRTAAKAEEKPKQQELPSDAEAIILNSAGVPEPQEEIEEGVLLAGRYQVVGRSGEWILGDIYLVEDINSNQEFRHLHLIHPDNYRFIGKNFQIRITPLLKLDHPNILRILDYRIDGEPKFLITEYTDSGNLLSLASTYPLNRIPEGPAMEIAWQLATACSVLQQKGIRHEQLRPQFIRFVAEKTVKLVFWGTLFTQGPYGLLTNIYMAPEQLSKGETYPESDIWSFGCILYDFLKGEPRYYGTNPQEVLQKIKENRAYERINDISVSINQLLESTLRYYFKQRPSGFDILIQQIEGILKTMKLEVPQPKHFVMSPAHTELRELLAADPTLAVEPTDAAGYRERAKKFLSHNRRKRALNDLNTAINLNPRDGHAYYLRGMIYKDKKSYEKAFRDFSQAIAIDTSIAGASFYRGLILTYRKLFDNALKDFKRANQLDENLIDILKEIDNKIENNPGVAEYHNDRAYVFYLRGNLLQATEEYTKSLELDPGDVRILLQRAQTWYKLGEYQKALKDYDQYIEARPEDVDGYSGRGHVHFAMKQVHKAIPDFTKAAQLNPSDSSAYNVCGNANYDRKNYDQAIKDFTRAIELNPNDALAYINRSYAYQKKGDTERSKKDRKTAQVLARNQKKDSTKTRRKSKTRSDETVLDDQTRIKPLGCGLVSLSGILSLLLIALVTS